MAKARQDKLIALLTEDDKLVMRAIMRMGEERVQGLISLHEVLFPKQDRVPTKQERKLLAQAEKFNKLFPEFSFPEVRKSKSPRKNTK